MIFFDPGYDVIDATTFHRDEKMADPYYLIFKDQTNDPLRYQIRYATDPTLRGPWRNTQAPLTESWSEGPSAIQLGREFVIFYDHYRAPRPKYEALESTDWQHWEAINDRITLPPDCKHGSFLRIQEAELLRWRDGSIHRPN